MGGVGERVCQREGVRVRPAASSECACACPLSPLCLLWCAADLLVWCVCACGVGRGGGGRVSEVDKKGGGKADEEGGVSLTSM